MATDRIVTEVAGIVSQVNGSGFRLEGRAGWVNVSKYASVALPRLGERVRVGLDQAGFVRAVEPDAAPAPAPPATAPEAPARSPAPLSAPDRLSARIAALQAATRIVARQPGTHGVGETLACAEQRFGWLAR